MADDDRALVPNEGLLAHEIQCQINLLRRGAAGADVIGLVAAALVLKMAAACRTMAEAFRHQHREPARDKERGKRAIFRLRHLRATQHVLRRGVRDQGKPERPIAGRAE
jgi:hypothetical protein